MDAKRGLPSNMLIHGMDMSNEENRLSSTKQIMKEGTRFRDTGGYLLLTKSGRQEVLGWLRYHETMISIVKQQECKHRVCAWRLEAAYPKRCIASTACAMRATVMVTFTKRINFHSKHELKVKRKEKMQLSLVIVSSISHDKQGLQMCQCTNERSRRPFWRSK